MRRLTKALAGAAAAIGLGGPIAAVVMPESAPVHAASIETATVCVKFSYTYLAPFNGTYIPIKQLAPYKNSLVTLWSGLNGVYTGSWNYTTNANGCLSVNLPANGQFWAFSAYQYGVYNDAYKRPVVFSGSTQWFQVDGYGSTNLGTVTFTVVNG